MRTGIVVKIILLNKKAPKGGLDQHSLHEYKLFFLQYD